MPGPTDDACTVGAFARACAARSSDVRILAHADERVRTYAEADARSRRIAAREGALA